MNMKVLYQLTFVVLIAQLFLTNNSFAQLSETKSKDSILSHKIVKDAKGEIIAWYKPEIPGAAYAQVAKLASEFLLKSCPKDEKTGLPFYLVTCCFQKPKLNENKYVAEDWLHNPACFFAGCVQSFAVDYYNFTGDVQYIEFVRGLLDHQLQFGTTEKGWFWENVPYSSSNPFEKEYRGGTKWEHQGMRGDGLHGIEPDKVGELGYGYLRFFEITGDEKYLNAALSCARALAKHVRVEKIESSPFIEIHSLQSPWPFRVNARTGAVISEYCSNSLDPIKLLDELIRIKDVIRLDTGDFRQIKIARNAAYNWLFSRLGPMHTYIWNGYFEDIQNDPLASNRVQITPGELAKHILKNPEFDKNYDKDVPALIHWIRSVFKTDGMNAIKEQTYCFEPMGSHTARYGSLCAMWYEKSGDEWYKNEAYKYLNFASYMTLPDGFVAVGPNWPGAWFSDGYSDYVRHYIDAMAAIPEWAPQNENHLLRSTSIVKGIKYEQNKIELNTFDPTSVLKFKLKKKPIKIKVNNLEVKIDGKDCSWTIMNNGGVLTLKAKGNQVHIVL